MAHGAPDCTDGGLGFTLSQRGSGRATAYCEFNKIVSVGDRTHVAWQDSKDGEFLIQVRALD